MEHMVTLHFRGKEEAIDMNKKYPIHAFSIFKLLPDDHKNSYKGREIMFSLYHLLMFTPFLLNGTLKA